MSMDGAFAVAKRFDYLHIRALLHQADVMAEIEEQLGALDKSEPIQTYLSSRRADENQDRRMLLQQLQRELKTNGKIIVILVTIFHYIAR